MLSWLIRVDHQVFLFLNSGLSNPWLDSLLWWVTTLGDGAPLVIAVGLGLWWYDRQAFWRHYHWLILAVLIGVCCTQALKYGFARPRPLATFAPLLEAGALRVSVVGIPLFARSFPSGHTQTAATVFTYLTCLYPRRWYLWGSGALLIGFSRIYVGAHFPVDVFVGLCLGFVNGGGVWWILHVRVKAAGGEAMPLRRWRRRAIQCSWPPFRKGGMGGF